MPTAPALAMRLRVALSGATWHRSLDEDDVDRILALQGLPGLSREVHGVEDDGRFDLCADGVNHRMRDASRCACCYDVLFVKRRDVLLEHTDYFLADLTRLETELQIFAHTTLLLHSIHRLEVLDMAAAPRRNLQHLDRALFLQLIAKERVQERFHQPPYRIAAANS